MAKRKKPLDLFDRALHEAEAARLTAELDEAYDERRTAQDISEPYAQAFWEAHRRLYATPLEAPKAIRFARYDERLRAGHAWEPHRARLKRASDWYQRVDKELAYERDQLADDKEQNPKSRGPREVQTCPDAGGPGVLGQ